MKPIEMLFLGSFQFAFQADKAGEEHRKQLEADLGQRAQLPLSQIRLRVIVCDPPFEIPGPVDAKGYWMRPSHPKPDDRRKLLRKHVFTGVAQALGFIARQRSRLLVGLGQGALITATLGLPLVV